MPFRYPISLELQGRRCVVLGGLEAGEHKVKGLLDAGAVVKVVSEQFTEGLRRLGQQRRVELVKRAYEPGDLEGAFLAVTAMEDSQVNSRIRQEAQNLRVLLNAVDDPPNCDFAVPSIIRRGDLMLAISTGGKAPALSKRLRKSLSEEIGPEYGELIDLLDEIRSEAIATRTVDFDTWAGRWAEALDHPLASLVRDGRTQDARDVVRAALSGEPRNPGSAGKVSIVGAGPGSPDLITVRGKRLIDEADVVVYDRLVSPDLIAGKRAVFAGKQSHGESADQTDINTTLIELARKGNQVVRLKGGDPFVFGRGSEEAEALAEAGIAFEVVPAPTSAIAGPGAAGIPVTDRRYASSVAFVTGHCAGRTVDWRGLSASADTLVILMGVANLANIVPELISGGRNASCPAAIVESASLPGQKVITTDLAGLAGIAQTASVRSPAVIVIGDVVRVRERIVEGERV